MLPIAHNTCVVLMLVKDRGTTLNVPETVRFPLIVAPVAVIFPVLNAPPPSLITIVLFMLELVAVVALFCTFPGEERGESFESAIAAELLIFAFTMTLGDIEALDKGPVS